MKTCIFGTVVKTVKNDDACVQQQVIDSSLKSSLL